MVCLPFLSTQMPYGQVVLHLKTVYTRGPPATHDSVLGTNSGAREVSRGQHSGVFPERRRRADRRWFALTVPVGRNDGGD